MRALKGERACRGGPIATLGHPLKLKVDWALPLSGAVLLLFLAGCASVHRGGPGGEIDFDSIPDAVPRPEPKSRYGNPPSYEVFGQWYQTLATGRGYVARGIASWYGPNFHGRRSSSGEPYDMYAMTAAHKTLPLPSYARVTNLDNGRSIVVRINDRGPFHDGRIIDLSYVAAGKLRLLGPGTAPVEVRVLDPDRPGEVPTPTLELAAARTAEVPARPVSPPLAVSAERPVAAVEGMAMRVDQVPAREPESAVVVSPPIAQVPKEPRLYVQVGAFGRRDNAERLREQLLDAIPHQIRIRESESAESAFYRVQVGPLRDRALAESVSQRLAAFGVTSTHLIVE